MGASREESVLKTSIFRRAPRLERTIQSDFLDLGGRPPLRFFRLACNCLKYSGPRLAISFPPFRPRLTAAGSFFFAKSQKLKLSLVTVLCLTPDAAPTLRVIATLTSDSS